MKKELSSKSYYLEKRVHDAIIKMAKKERRSASWWLNEQIKKLCEGDKKNG